MIQFRHDRARQLPPAPISYSSLRADQAIRTTPRTTGRRPGLSGGTGTGAAYPALLREIERTLVCHDMKPTRFGKEATGDGTLVFRLRKGDRITVAMRDRLLSFIATLDREAGHA